MINRLIFYVVESALLAVVAWIGLALALNGLRRLGTSVRIRHTRTLAALWLVLAIIDEVFSERFGPEFVMAYHLCFAIAVGGAVIWSISIFGRKLLTEDK